jgi:hypothetical protein
MAKTFWVLGCLFGMTAVAAGAFGAHALRARLPADLLAVFETGARYQMYHALALLAVAWAVERWPSGAAVAAGWAFVAGIVAGRGDPPRRGGAPGRVGAAGLGRLARLREASYRSLRRVPCGVHRRPPAGADEPGGDAKPDGKSFGGSGLRIRFSRNACCLREDPNGSVPRG